MKSWNRRSLVFAHECSIPCWSGWRNKTILVPCVHTPFLLWRFFCAYNSSSVLAFTVGHQTIETFCLDDVWRTSCKNSQTRGEISFLAEYVVAIRLQHTNLLFARSVVCTNLLLCTVVPSCVCVCATTDLESLYSASGQIRGIPPASSASLEAALGALWEKDTWLTLRSHCLSLMGFPSDMKSVLQDPELSLLQRCLLVSRWASSQC